jgi:hypothetical protein
MNMSSRNRLKATSDICPIFHSWVNLLINGSFIAVTKSHYVEFHCRDCGLLKPASDKEIFVAPTWDKNRRHQSKGTHRSVKNLRQFLQTSNFSFTWLRRPSQASDICHMQPNLCVTATKISHLQQALLNKNWWIKCSAVPQEYHKYPVYSTLPTIVKKEQATRPSFPPKWHRRKNITYIQCTRPPHYPL